MRSVDDTTRGGPAINTNNNDPKPSQINVVEPCPKRWSELEGDGGRRFCDQCSLHVVDGSALTRGEAESLVTGADERICMRLVRGEDGRFIHSDSTPAPRVIDRILRYGLAAAAGVLVACGDDRKEPTDPGTKSSTGSPTDPAPGDLDDGPFEVLGEVCLTEKPSGTSSGEVLEHGEIMGLVAPDFDGGDAPVDSADSEGHEVMGKVAPGASAGGDVAPDE